MPAPTLVGFVNGDSDWDTTSGTTRTVTFSNVEANDCLVIVGAAEDGANFDWPATPVTNDGTGLTWTQSNIHAGSQCAGLMATATVDANRASLIVSVSRTAGVSAAWGAGGWLWRGSEGVGTIVTANNAGGTGQPSLGVTTTQDNSAICCLNLDWTASSGARTYRQVNSTNPTESRYDGTAGGNYINESFYYADAGTLGANTVGLTVPSAQRYVIFAVEVKGSSTPLDPGWGKYLLEDGSGYIEMEGTTDDLLLDTAASDPNTGRPRNIFRSNPALNRSFNY